MYLLQIFSLNLQFIFPFSWPWTYRILHKYSKYVSSVPWKIQGKCTFGEGWDTTPRRRQWHPTPGLLPGKARGRRSLVGCSPWRHEELDMTEWLHFHVSLSWIGEGNGNQLQCSCLENPRDGGAWWAAIYGVAQSQTQLLLTQQQQQQQQDTTPEPVQRDQ